MAFPSSGVLSNFAAAQSNVNMPTWDTNWTRMFGLSVDWQGSAANIKGGHASSIGGDYYNAASYGPNSEVYITVTTLPTSGKTLRLYLRMQTPASAETGYRLVYTHGAPGTGHIQRQDAGATTSLVGPIGLTLAAGEKVGLEAKGNILTGYKYTAGAWAAVSGLTYDITPDGTKYTTAGYLGLATNTNTGTFDDFAGGNAYTYAFSGSAGLEICSQSVTDLIPGLTIKTVALIAGAEIATVAGVPLASITKVAGVAV